MEDSTILILATLFLILCVVLIVLILRNAYKLDKDFQEKFGPIEEDETIY